MLRQEKREMMVRMSANDVRVSGSSALPPAAAEYARAKIGSVIRHSPEPVMSARVKLTSHAGPTPARPVVAQVNLDVNGRLVRATAEAPSAAEAVDAVEAKLRRRIDRVARQRDMRCGESSRSQRHFQSPEWRHGAEPGHRPGYFPRPTGEREIVRHKSFPLIRLGLDEATWEMDLRDYDFFLFIESGSGQDSLLYRADPTGYRLMQLDPSARQRLSPFGAPVTINEQPAPTLTTAEAVTRLNTTNEPFLFFQDAQRRRGSVLYHRYDGHYGLITPDG